MKALEIAHEIRGKKFLIQVETSHEATDYMKYEEIRDEPNREVELLTIAYGTKKTVNTESAKRIASLLENKFGLEIDIVDLQHNPSLNKQYNNIIVGSSVEIGKWTTHTAVVKFLENNKYARIY